MQEEAAEEWEGAHAGPAAAGGHCLWERPATVYACVARGNCSF